MSHEGAIPRHPCSAQRRAAHPRESSSAFLRARITSTIAQLRATAAETQRALDWHDLRSYDIRVARRRSKSSASQRSGTWFTESRHPPCQGDGGQQAATSLAGPRASPRRRREGGISYQLMQIACCHEHPMDAFSFRALGLSPF